jgi:hypothetical protein
MVSDQYGVLVIAIIPVFEKGAGNMSDQYGVWVIFQECLCSRKGQGIVSDQYGVWVIARKPVFEKGARNNV